VKKPDLYVEGTRVPIRADTIMKMDMKSVMNISERGTPVPRSKIKRSNGVVRVQSMYLENQIARAPPPRNSVVTCVEPRSEAIAK